MNILKTNHWDFDFLNKKRNVYFAAGETQKAAEAQNEGAKNEKPGETASKPMEAADWKIHEQRVDKNLDPLKKVAPQVAEKAKKDSGAKMAKLESDYNKDLSTAKKERDKEAGNTAPAVKKFIKDKQNPANAGEKDTQKAIEGTEGAKLEGNDLNKAVDLIMKQAESEMGKIESQGINVSQNLKGMLSKPETRADLTKIVAQLNFSPKQIAELQNGKLTLSKEQSDAIMSAPSIPVEKDKKAPENIKLEGVDLDKAVDLIIEQIKKEIQKAEKEGIIINPKSKEMLSDPNTKTKLRKILSEMNFATTVITDLKKGTINLSDEQKDAIMNPKEDKKAPESEKGAEQLTKPEQIKYASEKIIAQLGVTDSEWKSGIENKIKSGEIKFTQEQIKAIDGKQDFELNKDQTKQIIDVMKVNEYDRKKGEAIGKKINELLGKIENKQAKEAIRNMFDTDEKPLRRYLVMNCNITEDEKEGLKINGNAVKEIKDITKYLPQSAQKNFDAMLAMKKDDKGDNMEKLQTDIWNAGNEGIGRLQNIKQMQDAIAKQMGLETADKSKSPIDAIVMFVKLFQSLKKAMNSGDWNSFTEFMDDWKEAKNDPKELDRRVNASKEAYKKTVDDPKFNPNVKDLFNAVKDIRGPEADKMFLANVPLAERGKSPLNRYRYEAKDALTDYAKNALGLSKIEEISKTGDRMTFKAEKDGIPMAVEMNFAPGKNEARVIREIKDKDGNWTKPTSEGIAYQPMENGMAGLKNIIEGGGAKKETPATQPATAPATKGESAPAAQPNTNEAGTQNIAEVAKNFTKEQLAQFRVQLLKNPTLKSEYNKFVKEFKKGKDIKKWTPENQTECRKAFLESKFNNDDVKKIVESIAKTATKKPANTEVKSEVEKK